MILGSGTAAEVYLIGGIRLGGTYYDEVWKSGDGASWTHVNSAAPSTAKFSARSGHSSVTVKDAAGDTIYVIGGLISGGSQQKDVWKSVDRGETWTEVTAAAQFGRRDNHSSVVLGGALYVIGGKRTGGLFYNDVWKSTDGGVNWVNVHKNN